MEHRRTFTDMELEFAKNNYQWLAEYYRPLQGATVSRIYIGISDDDDMLAFPVIDFQLTNGEIYTCDIVCAGELNSPGFISGLPFSETPQG